MRQWMASQITGLTIVYSNVYSGADQENINDPRHWPFVWGIHRWLMNSPTGPASSAKKVSIWWRCVVKEVSRNHWQSNIFWIKNNFTFSSQVIATLLFTRKSDLLFSKHLTKSRIRVDLYISNLSENGPASLNHCFQSDCQISNNGKRTQI